MENLTVWPGIALISCIVFTADYKKEERFLKDKEKSSSTLEKVSCNKILYFSRLILFFIRMTTIPKQIILLVDSMLGVPFEYRLL